MNAKKTISAVVNKVTRGIANTSYSHFFLFILLLTLLVYHKTPLLFFQQDEWRAFGLMISLGKEIITQRFMVGDIDHFVPLSFALNLLTFKLFGLNHIAYNLIALSFHLLNSFLVFLTSKKLFNNENFFYFFSTIFIFFFYLFF